MGSGINIKDTAVKFEAVNFWNSVIEYGDMDFYNYLDEREAAIAEDAAYYLYALKRELEEKGLYNDND